MFKVLLFSCLFVCLIIHWSARAQGVIDFLSMIFSLVVNHQTIMMNKVPNSSSEPERETQTSA
jgi:hypothetical protein